jgi:hypothetical protein
MNTATALVSYTPMTEREFGVVFAKLANQLGSRDVDLATIQSYYEALQDLPLEGVRQAATAFSRERGRRWLPGSPEWREKVEEVQRETLRQVVQPTREKAWQSECEDCGDTGWVMGLECDGRGSAGRGCDRDTAHRPHTFTRVCPCRLSNRTWQRHQSFGRGAA